MKRYLTECYVELRPNQVKIGDRVLSTAHNRPQWEGIVIAKGTHEKEPGVKGDIRYHWVNIQYPDGSIGFWSVGTRLVIRIRKI